MKFDKAYNVMKNGEEQHVNQQCIKSNIAVEVENKDSTAICGRF